MKKLEPPKTSKPADGVDLISDMPDAILLLILSRLPSTEEAIRSSILSRRWRNLWTAIPSLDLHDGEKSQFKEFVYWVLVKRSVDLDCFRLSSSHLYSMSTVGRWINAAVTRNVKQLELTFYPKNNEYIQIPHCLVTCGSLEVLKLNSNVCGLRLPKTMGFPSLRVLDLAFVDLLEDADLVKNFLKNCPLLEDLSLSECLIFKFDLLCISCQKLKKLTIINFYVGKYDGVLCGGIKISCPKLVDLELRGYIGHNCFFECLDSLKKALIVPKLEGNNKCVLFPGISSVESLWIDPYFFIECINTAACDPVLPNLKTLVLSTTMDAFTFDNFNQILKYYPKLESLKLVIQQAFRGSDGTEYGWLDEDETWSILSNDVKRVEFFEFNGEKPKVVTEWFEDILDIFFSWGNEARFSNCYW
ncbi:F-box/LRR-repeat protein 13 [Lactuca sativa]|uniref:F-box domain-containing protein n=1 Tax=Lactuca sativa TaxID=4236 RepID=A0A9R1X7T0_LACSA|nr:F-box/LRR-repeat protein 13 [Lactuca sativa]KAJ0204055.1 hypothetical protein LSAT_V11C500255620 [Lactuca sativa]